MINEIEKVLIDTEELNEIVSRIAHEIDIDYAGEDRKLVLVCILKGSVVFMGDLMKKLTIPVEIDFMRVSSYGGETVSSGHVNIILDLMREDLAKCDLIVIEDIIDSGRTLSYLIDYLKLKGARSVKTCTLLDKPERRVKEVHVDYTCFNIPDEFVVGYGLDYAQRYRNLPFIGVVEPGAGED